MPDEIAIRVQAGRFIQDQGMATGLFALCANRLQAVPGIFIPSAWLLSLGDLAFSPIDLRVISISALVLCAVIAMRGAFKNANHAAMLWMVAAFLGVSGSTLVFFRFEVFLIIHLCLCMTALQVLKKNQPGILHLVLTGALLFSLLTMGYVHPQAFLFIPLTAYLCYRLICGTRIDVVKLFIGLALFAGIAVTIHFFFQLSCVGHKEIEIFWGEMIFDMSRLVSADFFNIIKEKFKLFAFSFTYNDSYTIGYLPGITKDMFAARGILNAAIVIGLLMVMVTGVMLGCAYVYRFVAIYILRRQQPAGFDLDAAVGFSFIFFPSLFYLLYDAHLYFYRSFIINFLFVIAVVIGLSTIDNKLLKTITAYAGGVLCLVCAFSIYTNFAYFYKPIQTYEGPSASLDRDWAHAPERLNRFAQSCGIDLTKGGGIIDDVTYEGVKQYPRVYQITYLGLQMGLAKIKPETVITTLKPNYVLARCSEMEAIGLGWPADKQEGDLCCKRYSPASE
ncbi:MAG: hypothetical protein SFW65_02855 [Alphaproteobacteria bacterium]|nr:hypothetical protein [Alphaproteobacteria bacterium]